MILGDFNTICHPHKKEGGRQKSQRQMDEFNKLVEDIQMQDLGAKGQLFTWCKNCSGVERVRKRLD